MANPKRMQARRARTAETPRPETAPSVPPSPPPAAPLPATPLPAPGADPDVAALLPPTRYTVRKMEAARGALPVLLPIDTVVTLRGLAELHGRPLDLVVQASLVSYLKLTRSDQERALALEPARPTVEQSAWGGVTPEGGLLGWARTTKDQARQALGDPDRVVRVTIRYEPLTTAAAHTIDD